MNRSKAFMLVWGVALPLLMLCVGPAARAGDSFRVVVNPANPVSALSPAFISKLFLKKISRWDHGEAVLPVDRPSDSALRARFSEAVHGKPVSAIQAYWQQQVFSGQGVGPPELADDSEVLAHVEGHPGAIGYVSASAVTKDVKVIEILR